MFNGIYEKIESSRYIDEARKRTSILWLGHTYETRIPARINNNISVSLNIEVTRFEPDILEDIFRITDTYAKMYSITSASEWMDFIETCYSLGISGDGDKRKKGWRAKDGVKEKFKNWMDTEKIREKVVDDSYDPMTRNYFKYNILKANKDDSIITAFDQRKGCRLIVDGIHRGWSINHGL